MRLRDELGRFLAAVEREGIPASVTRRWVTNLRQYETLLAVAESGVDEVTTEAVRAIQWAIGESAQLGQPAATAMTTAAVGTEGPRLATTGVFGQVNVGAITQLVGQLQTSSPLRALPGLGEEAVQQMQRELVRGLANGEHSRAIGRRIAKTTDIPAARAATIARTEIHRAYRESNRLAYQANPMVEQWRWYCDLSPRTCSSCWSMHGTLHDLGDPMGTHPNCRCTQLPVVDHARLRALGIDAPDVDYPTGEELFAKLPVADQREILGPGKLEAYQSGKITLADTVHVHESPEWGTTRSTASLGEALGARV